MGWTVLLVVIHAKLKLADNESLTQQLQDGSEDIRQEEIGRLELYFMLTVIII